MLACSEAHITASQPVVPTPKQSLLELITPQQAERLAEVFRLMGDPTRMRILYLLLDRGEQYVAVIAAGVGATETTVSHALRLLRTAHVVSARREGRHIAYALADDHVRHLLAMAREHLDHQDSP